MIITLSLFFQAQLRFAFVMVTAVPRSQNTWVWFPSRFRPKGLKVDNYNFPALCSALKRHWGEQIGQVHLFLVQIINGIASTFKWLNRKQVTTWLENCKRSLRCLVTDATWQINEQNANCLGPLILSQLLSHVRFLVIWILGIGPPLQHLRR